MADEKPAEVSGSTWDGCSTARGVKGPLELVRVDPIGREVVPVFAHALDGTPVYEREVDVYPLSQGGEALRRLRSHRLGLSLREAAARLGISIVELSSLERGRLTCDWVVARRMLEERSVFE